MWANRDQSNAKPFHWRVDGVQSWMLLKTYNSRSRSMTMWRPTFAITSLLAKTHVYIGIFIYTTHTHIHTPTHKRNWKNSCHLFTWNSLRAAASAAVASQPPPIHFHSIRFNFKRFECESFNQTKPTQDLLIGCFPFVFIR